MILRDLPWQHIQMHISNLLAWETILSIPNNPIDMVLRQ